VHSYIHGSVAKRREFREQFPAIRGITVIGLVIAEVSPNWSERAIGLIRMYNDLHRLRSFLRPGVHAGNEHREQNNRAEAHAALRERRRREDFAMHWSDASYLREAALDY
jgi:hypothetical protein